MSSTIIMIHLIGAVALLIWGLGILRNGMNQAFGSRMRFFLGAGTENRMKAFSVGLLTTLVLQSSTATAVMTSSFVEQGLITFMMSLAIMLGADVGTSAVAQLVSLKIVWLSPFCIILGLIVPKFKNSARYSGLGTGLVGLGLMLLALKLMGEATAPMHSSEAIRTLFSLLGDAPIFAVLAAGLMAAATASSLAVVLFIMSLFQANAIDPLLAVYLVVGANLGGAFPPLFIVGKISSARQVILGNLLMRACGVLIVLLLSPLLKQIISSYEFNSRFVVDVHVAFNIALALLFLPLIGSVAKLVDTLSPIPPVLPDAPKFLVEEILETPLSALTAAERETLRVGDTVERMLENSLLALRNDDEQMCASISLMDNKVDRLQEAIKQFIYKIDRSKLSESEIKLADEIISYSINLEHIGDIIDKSLSSIIQKKSRNQLSFSANGFSELEIFYMRTIENFHIAQTIFMTRDQALARQLVQSKVEIRRMEIESSNNHLKRYQEGHFETISSSSLHLDILRDLKRINAHLTSVAYPILDELGVLRESRLRSPPS